MKNSNIFRQITALVVITFALATTSCKKEESEVQQPLADVLTATGDSLSIVSTLAQFKSLLGDSLNTAPGKFGGRREINWDAVPATFQDNNNFPSDFFAQTDAALPNGRKRGAIFSTSLTNELRISSIGYEDIYAGFASQFKVFSPKLLFGTVNGNIVDVTFKVPGETTDATVKGFGVIFSDVDKDNKTSLEFFDENEKSLGKFFAKSKDAQFSFLGVKFKDASKVNKVRITVGEEGIVKINSTYDKVAMDDFLYDEPIAK